jgi:hypothetical protein
MKQAYKVYFILLIIGLLMLIYSFVVLKKDPVFGGSVKPKYTRYIVTVNNKVVTCRYVEHSKLGYNLRDCDNESRYFNVTNIEMAVGE